MDEDTSKTKVYSAHSLISPTAKLKEEEEEDHQFHLYHFVVTTTKPALGTTWMGKIRWWSFLWLCYNHDSGFI